MNLWIFCLVSIASAEVATIPPRQYLHVGNAANITQGTEVNIVLDMISLTDSIYDVYMAFVECSSGLSNIQANQIIPETQLGVRSYNLDKNYEMPQFSFCIAIQNASPTKSAQILYNYSITDVKKRGYVLIIVVSVVLGFASIACCLGYYFYKKYKDTPHERLLDA